MADRISLPRIAVSRRELIKSSAVAGVVLAMPAYVRPAWAQQKSVVVVNSGGAMGDASAARSRSLHQSNRYRGHHRGRL